MTTEEVGRWVVWVVQLAVISIVINAVRNSWVHHGMWIYPALLCIALLIDRAKWELKQVIRDEVAKAAGRVVIEYDRERL